MNHKEKSIVLHANVEEFLKLPGCIIDVRSPKEFQHAHIPNSQNIPLFSDQERHLVGCCYKKRGHQAAVALGLEITASKIESFQSIEPKAKFLCWRGGLRSGFMSRLFNFWGVETVLLTGGYKAFRGWVLRSFETKKKIHLVGGLTGVGKTEKLYELKERDEQVLDLEGLANHRGSSFGHIGMKKQPSSEQFENMIALEWHHFSDKKPIWIENESANIGGCFIPDALFHQMKQAPLFLIESPIEERLDRLVENYGSSSKEELIAATERIGKKLGSERTKQAIEFINSGEIKSACKVILTYYDKTYSYTMKKRIKPVGLDVEVAHEYL